MKLEYEEIDYIIFKLILVMGNYIYFVIHDTFCYNIN